MAWTQADLVAIETAISTGQRSVSLDNRSVTYQTVDQMLKARDAIVKQLGADASVVKRPRAYRARQCKGI